MATISLYYNNRRQNASGEYEVQIRITQLRKSAYIGTSVFVREGEFVNNEIIRTHPRAKVYNNAIRAKLIEVEDFVLQKERTKEIQSLSALDIKNAIIDKTIDKSNEFIDFFEAFGNSREKPRTRAIYQETIRKIGQFTGARLQFQDISIAWLREFEFYMKENGISINGRSIHFRNIRAVLNEAINQELTEVYPFRKFKIKKEETIKRSLTITELNVLKNLRLEPFQEKYRDLFFLMIYLIGINADDLFHLTEDNIKEGILTYKRAKTGKIYKIKVEPEAQQLINKLRGNNHLIYPLDTAKNTHNALSSINDELQKLGRANVKARGVFPNLSTYWTRHTWATIASSLDISKDIIAEALGHSSNSVTDIYINFDKRKVHDANRRVIDYITR